ncbi:hypothetical protein HDV05_006826, partial [Chytridiales sp. JEL 0842]
MPEDETTLSELTDLIGGSPTVVRQSMKGKWAEVAGHDGADIVEVDQMPLQEIPTPHTVKSIPLRYYGNAEPIAGYIAAKLGPKAKCVWVFGPNMSLKVIPSSTEKRDFINKVREPFPVAYHVANVVIYRGQPLIFDPIMMPRDGDEIGSALLPVSEWFTNLNNYRELLVCGSSAVFADGPCIDDDWFGEGIRSARVKFFNSILNKLISRESTWLNSTDGTPESITMDVQKHVEELECLTPDPCSTLAESAPPSNSLEQGAPCEARIFRRSFGMSNIMLDNVALNTTESYLHANYSENPLEGLHLLFERSSANAGDVVDRSFEFDQLQDGLQQLPSACLSQYLAGKPPLLNQLGRDSERPAVSPQFRRGPLYILCKRARLSPVVIRSVHVTVFSNPLMNPLITSFSVRAGDMLG